MSVAFYVIAMFAIYYFYIEVTNRLVRSRLEVFGQAVAEVVNNEENTELVRWVALQLFEDAPKRFLILRFAWLSVFRALFRWKERDVRILSQKEIGDLVGLFPGLIAVNVLANPALYIVLSPIFVIVAIVNVIKRSTLLRLIQIEASYSDIESSGHRFV